MSNPKREMVPGVENRPPTKTKIISEGMERLDLDHFRGETRIGTSRRGKKQRKLERVLKHLTRE